MTANDQWCTIDLYQYDRFTLRMSSWVNLTPYCRYAAACSLPYQSSLPPREHVHSDGKINWTEHVVHYHRPRFLAMPLGGGGVAVGRIGMVNLPTTGQKGESRHWAAKHTLAGQWTSGLSGQ
ncbi:unnamed protein product [Protopolystoma xenopodis]|uniref:Uncharacterized protein n=1 Tax=Protopolystoma xenopodis TaxID=117903 RepID=A0A448WCH2_9PLAT|nr:unnamed protein product [Protopolystoma xenopodis]